MAQLYWQTIGEGKHDLVLLHGWGLNAAVWQSISERAGSHFRLHLVDLPGFGRSQGFPAMSLQEMAAEVVSHGPDNAIWLGWSLGGLVASQIALSFPEAVTKLITVASSPRFCAGTDWPGIKPATLEAFQQQLSTDFQRTIERFLALQTLGSDSARHDARQLKQIVLQQPMPSVDVLQGGLDILRTTDLREAMQALQVPCLQIYGALDGLVPRSIAQLPGTQYPDSHAVVIEKAAHAPFISHPQEFCQSIIQYIVKPRSCEQ